MELATMFVMIITDILLVIVYSIVFASKLHVLLVIGSTSSPREAEEESEGQQGIDDPYHGEDW